MSIYLDKLAHLQVVINCQYSDKLAHVLVQSTADIPCTKCTWEDILACYFKHLK